MRPLYSLFAVGLSTLAVLLTGCDKEDSPFPLKSAKGIVIGPSCNGLLIELLDGPQIGKPLNIYNRQYRNVFGAAAAQPELTAKWGIGDTVTFSVRKPTKQDAAPRLCLAIYVSYDVPQLTIDAPQ
ncbi:hypothetical protein [Hymenobacter fodinae]|uniref:Uncharacterized protein n=1 Tax=Hymenobacter fodinae TaxID=2510796 RepID=A0A4Z0P6Q8_9BACT|nr:hypothetical protein [Hymenobacter fodinae]TGE07618.1 hypothetical protein EU556_07635 [Hymenobacter fodinae]